MPTRRCCVSNSVCMMSTVRSIPLNTGAGMPIIGLGTWQIAPAECSRVVKQALDIGYRHFDCASLYGNQAELGVAFQENFGKNLKREDVFITSKLPSMEHRIDQVKPALLKVLSDLRLDYLDLYLMHSPAALKEGTPMRDDGKIELEDTDYIDTWKAMEKLYDEGLVKAIGLSNFNSSQVQRVLDLCRVKPVVNQVELHPFNSQPDLVSFCESRGIVMTAYAPFAAPDRTWADASDPVLLKDKTILSMAEKYGKTPAQVLLRYSIDRGMPVIPKSSNQARLRENFNVFDFGITEDDMTTLNRMDIGFRTYTIPRIAHSPYYPF